MINLDHAATTAPDERVISAVAEAMRTATANPSAAYSAAGAARAVLRRGREAAAAALNARADEIWFTSGGTEADNWAVKLAAGRHAVISAVEHHAVLNAAKLWGCAVTWVAPDERGRITAAAVERALRRDTALIAVQYANNETGVIHEIAEIGALARARRVPFLCDAVQAVGHVPVDMRACAIDLLALSAHKFYGPRGVGCLAARTGIALSPLIAGGGQQQGLRGGTEDVPAIAGMAAAMALFREDLDAEAARERALTDRLAARLTREYPGARRLGEGAPRLPGIAAMLLPGLESERAVPALDTMGFQVSGGAACSARDGAASHVYTAMGLSAADARCVLRFSVGRENTEADVDAAVDAVLAVAGR